MVMEGETIALGAPSTCSACGLKLVNWVLRSAAGFYIGTQCSCGPYSRESKYYPTHEDAQYALDTNNYGR